MCWGFQFTITDDGTTIEDRCVNGVRELRELLAAHGFPTNEYLELFEAGEEIDEGSCLCGVDTGKTCIIVGKIVIQALGWNEWLDDIEMDDIDPSRVIGHIINKGIDNLTMVGFSSGTREVNISWF
jgi:hypothetical protein